MCSVSFLVLFVSPWVCYFFFFFNDTATTEIYTFPYTTLFRSAAQWYEKSAQQGYAPGLGPLVPRSEEHTSELQSRLHLVCRLLLEKKKRRARQSIRYRKNHIRPCIVLWVYYP